MENPNLRWTFLEEEWHAISVVEITIKRVMRYVKPEQEWNITRVRSNACIRYAQEAVSLVSPGR